MCVIFEFIKDFWMIWIFWTAIRHLIIYKAEEKI